MVTLDFYASANRMGSNANSFYSFIIVFACKVSIGTIQEHSLVFFFSNQWRAVASCILTNLLSCRAIQFLPDIFPYELNGRTVYDLIDISNVVTFCGKCLLILFTN